MKNKLLVILLLLMILGVGGYAAWQQMAQGPFFTCRAQVHREVETKICNKTSAFDLFLSINGKNQGYLLISGSYSCPNAMPTHVDGVVNFTYSKEGDYYSFYIRGGGGKFADIFDVLKFDNIKMKLTKLNYGVYMISLPNEILMMCTEA
ncbi:hypothetical protein [Serratia sp. PL7]|uniref:hypothetical protein n=1 Tax=Serratia sp. PL7 TaxID=2952201 RepID=UPI001A05A4F4|nr:hypothetical protein [Serratia sp. PL7]MBE0153063.1 hypothetical protein [Serratia fonticola]